MTDPEFADATYIEPITAEFVEKVIAKERPDALLPTLGGQTALNAAMQLHENGVLERYGVELIGANVEAIKRGENREQFRSIVEEIGAESARSRICHTMDEVLEAAGELGYPLVVRPSFTMGGSGSGFAHTENELRDIATAGLLASPTTEVLIEESIFGWKEFELELMRDKNDNVVIVCSIENFDPMGVHTGDSITVAPAMTLTDREFQHMRDVGIDIIRKVGVDTGGCNIQFAINPVDGRMIVIEMNPRVSRSSALASKATGFPIAKIAAKLAIGYALDEIPNDITKMTPASFEPTLDYVVVKIPRFAFEKFPGANPRLTTHMKSVGEAMAIGRNFTEALQKALRSIEKKGSEFEFTKPLANLEELLVECSYGHEYRINMVQQALWAGASLQDVHEVSKIDPWFLAQIDVINQIARELLTSELDTSLLRKAKRHGFSDSQIASIRGVQASEIRQLRKLHGVRPVFKTVDTCAAEFEAFTPYHYSTYDQESEVAPRSREAVFILGSGPNRIGQGIEFDYSCVHASLTLRDLGYDTIMINCNPETVSTDYDTSSRLYFEPLTIEDVLEVIDAESALGPVAGVICQLGGQTPLGLASELEAAGVQILGTSPTAIHLAEERGAFGKILRDNDLQAPPFAMASTFEEARGEASAIGYPVLVRPSYVLGGRGMAIVYDEDSLAHFLKTATEIEPNHPVLIDRFLDDAIEIDVDALYDGEELFLAGIMEHIEEAGIHSGDSACTLPPITLGSNEIERIHDATLKIAKAVNVRGLINIQFALSGDVLYVLEANPRASRTVPFVSKATNVALAKAAARIAVGMSIAELRAVEMLPTHDARSRTNLRHIAVKEAVLPFSKFHGVDTVLGPEMKSTGEVMGINHTFGAAFLKAQLAANSKGLPRSGKAFVSVADRDKRAMIFPIKRLHDLGFELFATSGTADVLRRNGVAVTEVRKHSEGLGPFGEPTIVDQIMNQEIDLIINTPHGRGAREDGYAIRTAASLRSIPSISTVQGLAATVQALEALLSSELSVQSLQEYAAELAQTGQ